MAATTSRFGISLFQRLAASLKGAADILIIRDPTYVTYFSRFNPYCTSHGVDLVVFPDGTAVLFTAKLRSWATLEADAGRLAPGLKVIIYEQYDEGEPSPFLPALREHLLAHEAFSRHRSALEHPLDERPEGQTGNFGSLKIGIDRIHLPPPKLDEIIMGFPGADLIDCTGNIDECKLVLDGFHLDSLFIAVELAEVCFVNCCSAIQEGALFTHASDFGKIAMKTYQKEYWPEADLAGIASRDGFSLDGWNLAVTRERALRQTKPVRAEPGEPWKFYVTGFVNGMGVEFSCEGGDGLSNEQNAAYQFLLDLQTKLPSLLKPGVTSQIIHSMLDKQLAEGGYEMLDVRPGHAVINPIHDVPTLSKNNRNAFPAGSVVAIEPAIIRNLTSGIELKACYSQTCLLTDQGAQPLNSIRGSPSPGDDQWTVDGVSVGRPDLRRARSYRLEFGRFMEAVGTLARYAH